ncbi:MAG: methylated-DNA--[protein]-cysteine S-methyltransferase, partial [Deltaproteobacteria bacterium]
LRVRNIYYWEFQCSGLTVHVASSAVGAVRVKIGFTRQGDFISEFRSLAPRAEFFEDLRPNEALINVIEAYLKGDNPPMNLPWDINATPFRYNVWRCVCKIPYGETRNYKDIAFMVGSPKGARAVGQALKKNPLLILIPCHRVVSINGLGGFGAGIDLKRYLLNLERAGFGNNK